MAANVECGPLFELCFLTGLCHHHLGNQDRADVFLKAAFYSAHAVDSCYAIVCREYLCQRTDYPVREYMRSLDVLLLHSFLPNVYGRYSRMLYVQKRHDELLKLSEQIDIATLKCSPSNLSGYYFFYSQALAEVSRTEDAVRAATTACALNDLIGLFRNAPVLKRALREEYAVDFTY